jgi:oligopeptide transport system substrate-binding protein
MIKLAARSIRAAGPLALLLALVGCAGLDIAPAPTPTPAPATVGVVARPTPTPPAPTAEPTLPPVLPTATAVGTPAPAPGRYDNPDLGISLRYPEEWTARPGTQAATLIVLDAPDGEMVVVLFYSPMPADASLEQAAKQIRDGTASGVKDVAPVDDRAIKLADGRDAWVSEYDAAYKSGGPIKVIVTSAARGGRLFSLRTYGPPDSITRARTTLDDIAAGMILASPLRFGIPEDQALFDLGGESTNPRVYDPATGGGDQLVFSGLVALSPQLQVIPDVAEGWDISPDGTVYTFHLRQNARFHNHRPVTAQDVVYSWERAADPAVRSDTVLTYLGDIVGVAERRAGKADQIAGLRAVDDRTLEVTIDAPKPYFLMKLTYRTANIVDRGNVESGPEWYRTPNGTGPYRLIRWEHNQLQLYERNDDFYLTPPAIRYIVVQLYAGIGIRMYETGEIDMTGIGAYDLERVRDPSEPLHRDLIEGVSMCTSYVSFDAAQPPFEDPKVRQAFALAVDRQRYSDLVLRGSGIPARGLYPPALPGYSAGLRGLDFDPDLARRRLAESTYGGVAKLPPIIFTRGGFGSEVGPSVATLIAMWQQHLGVTIQVENLEPNKAQDELHAGHHGQIFSSGWCADYPDPENFADALFHSSAQQNLGHYANPALDRLLEQARIERDVTKRIQMYQQAEQQIVDDAPAIFLSHSLSFVLVKPRIKGYVLTPIAVPIERYLSIGP